MLQIIGMSDEAKALVEGTAIRSVQTHRGAGPHEGSFELAVDHLTRGPQLMTVQPYYFEAGDLE